MLDFKRIELTDRSWAEELLAKADFRGSEYAFSNNYIYRKIYHIEVARMDDYYLVRTHKHDRELSYLFPAGAGDLRPVIDALAADAAGQGVPFRMHGACQQAVDQLEAAFPGRFQFTPVRDNFDYIYERERLVTLSGKKLHAKRNFVNRFLAEQEGKWQFEQITDANLDECWAMNEQWCAEVGCEDSESLTEESCAVRNCFNNFHSLGLRGGLLRVEGRIVAYTMGRPLSSDTFIVHIEKAFAEVAGAYPMINQQFVTHCCEGFRYINREDDVGDEGLRRAKTSYKPDILLEKYLVTEQA